jgi:hypothetical protein
VSSVIGGIDLIPIVCAVGTRESASDTSEIGGDIWAADTRDCDGTVSTTLSPQFRKPAAATKRQATLINQANAGGGVGQRSSQRNPLVTCWLVATSNSSLV